MFYEMVKRQYYFTLTFLMFTLGLFSQTGGREIYQFMNLSPGARVSALGGMPIAWKGDDPAAAFLNPSLLSDKMDGKIQFSHQYYFADIRSGHVSYNHNISKLNLNTQFGIHYINHGDIVNADVYGNTNGSFNAKESDFYVAASKTIKERLTLGVSLQYISSKLGLYTSQGLAMNTGVQYHNPDKNFDLSLVFKNSGFQLSKYNNESEVLPFEIQLGLAKKLKHLPLIYHITFQHLEKWNLRYDDPDIANESVLFGDTPKENKFEDALGNFLRHFVIGAELNLGKKENFSLRLAYNHLRKKDLSLVDYRSFSGLSFGFGLKIYKFKFDYSYASYHLAGGTSQIGFSTNIYSFIKKEM